MAALLAVPAAGAPMTSRAVPPPQPNIVFVLTDDLSWNLVQYMPHVQEMQTEGVTFSRFVVTDSLCCPSRASILTGDLPHDTGVYTNDPPNGGFQVFHERGEEGHTFAVRLHGAGYRTALMGKYLNGYEPTKPVDGVAAYVPRGWDEWAVGGQAYKEFDYALNENGNVVKRGSKPEDYLTDVLARKGADFIRRAADDRVPFLLEIATFAPHDPYTPAPRHASDFPDLQAPRSPAFNEDDVGDKPPWLRNYPPLREGQIDNLNKNFRKRAQAVEAIDDLLVRLQTALRESGQLENTYVFFASDNGFHMGEHRLRAGKLTAFETDIVVPLIVTGPDVRRGTVSKLASNVDLYPTFVRLAGLSVPGRVDGRSFLPLLRTKPPKRWWRAVLVEHRRPVTSPGDPDQPAPDSGNPPSYEAIRLPTSTYVEYADRSREYYDLRTDPHELTNSFFALSKRRRAFLHKLLVRMERCHSGRACWRAAGPVPLRARRR